MIGHEPSLSQTNTYGWVPLCECGWIGGVVQPALSRKDNTPRTTRTAELTKSIALDAHAIHLHEVRADIARQVAEALAGIGRSINAANATLQRPRRWGRP